MKTTGAERADASAPIVRGTPLPVVAPARMARPPGVRPVRRAGRALLARLGSAASRVLPALGLTVAMTTASAAERVTLPSLDAGATGAVELVGWWFAAPAVGAAGAASEPAVAARRAPAVALFHGCNGAYAPRSQRLTRQMLDYAAFFNAQGLHALVVDSMRPRRVVEVCTRGRGEQPAVTIAARRLDALGAVAWLATRADVDSRRIGIVGFSHGGSTVLAAVNRRDPAVAAAPAQPAFAVAFYPGCAPARRHGFEAALPLLILIGDADDWTPAAPCVALVAEARGVRPQIELYPGAAHAFDIDAALRFRTDVSNGVDRAGVHVGRDESAARASRERLAAFVAAF
ncbi:dienelactone hydrolase family protein [Piscinibacter koreensis]|uniref:Dienelactone hydrolase family protein n=1 Tax=Piscinibacter koreensis TaxID=2742824 RepID=A0A7Y6NR83_9BURK|nr:dienelactone hydrolase family protein [Schlegelella koreensis]NUZ07845.1 dienelactone hydrolase family protein [Schlegelella koreensis]